MIRVGSRRQQHQSRNLFRIKQCIGEDDRASPRVTHQNGIFDSQRSEGLMQDHSFLLYGALHLTWHFTEPMSGKIEGQHAIVARYHIQCAKLEILPVAGIAVNHHYRSTATAVDIMQLCMADHDESFARRRIWFAGVKLVTL